MDFCNAESDLRALQEVTTPSTAQFCMICLDTDSKLYPLSKHNLDTKFEHLTGFSLHDVENFLPQFCIECAQRLTTCSGFREKALRAYHLLLEVAENSQELTTQDVKSIDRETNQLTSSLTKKSFEPDHCDLYFIHAQEEVKIELNTVENEINATTTKNSAHTYKNGDTAHTYKNGHTAHTDKNDHTSKNDYVIDIEPKTEDLDAFKSDSDDDFLYDTLLNDTEEKDVKSHREHNENMNEIFSKVTHNEEFSKDDAKIFNVNNNKKQSGKKTKSKNSSRSNKIVKPKTVLKKRVKDGKIKKVVKKEKVSAKNEENGTKDALAQFKVTLLSFEEQLAEIEKRREGANFKYSRYKCNKCFKGFSSVPTYESHMEKHTNKFGEFECEVCKVHVKSDYLLRHHVRHTHSVRYTCGSCPFVTNQKLSAIRHEGWHAGKTFKCPHCDEEYSKRTSYLSHLRVSHPTDVVCTLCGFSFINERGLNMHMNLKHRFDDAQSAAGPLCAPCDIRFASQTAYTQHLEVSPKHTSADKLKVNAPKRPRKNRLKPLDCETLECEQCGVQVRSYKMYSTHFNRFHPDKTRTQYPAHSPQRFLCEQCGRVFKNQWGLRDHVLVKHSGVKEFVCDTCNKSFCLKASLTAHMKTHSDSQPTHACPICGKHFTSKANTNRHILTHRESRPFKCHACEKTFVNASSRRYHELHAHLKQPWPKKNRGPRQRASRARHTKEAVYTMWPKMEVNIEPAEFQG